VRTSSPSTLQTARAALTLVWEAERVLVMLLGAAAAISAIAIAGQLLLGRELLDQLTADVVDGTALTPLVVGIGVLLFVTAVANTATHELRHPLTDRVRRRVTEQVLEVAAEATLEAYEGPEFHDRLRRARTDAGEHSASVVWGVVTTTTTLLTSVAVAGVLLAVAPILVPVAMAGYIPIALANIANNRALYRLDWTLTELAREQEYLEHLLTHRSAAKEVRAFGIVDRIRAWYASLWDLRLHQLTSVVRRRLALSAAASGVTALVTAVALGVALYLTVDGQISVGDAAVAVVGLQQLSARLAAAGDALSSVHEGVVFLRDFESLRRLLPDIRASRPRGIPPDEPRRLEVERLTYRYPGSDEPVVNDVSFAVDRDQVLAIVGANGSGKSTLAKLLSGLLPPSGGQIRWDGVNIAGCDPALVSARIAPVFQDFVNFELRVRDAIGLGAEDRIDDVAGIARAADQAGLTDAIDGLPEGLATRLGKAFSGGVDLSGGQWQRLAIARAFFRDAPIVIFDEPSASMDPVGEAELFDRLHALCQRRIVIFVSHRFATVRSADVVLVMDQGRVVESGSHAELMAEGGLYHDLFTLQAERYGIGG
jgi:ATP-binding cassette, subfamily B, bacterial